MTDRTDDRLPDELRHETDHAGNPLSLEQWQQIDAWVNPTDPEPELPPVTLERQYLLDCLADGHHPIWWPTHTPDEFAAMLHEGAESDAEHWFADAILAAHTARPADDDPDPDDPDPDWTGRPAADVEAEQADLGLNDGHDPVTTVQPAGEPGQ
jgi:hypothetical protein